MSNGNDIIKEPWVLQSRKSKLKSKQTDREYKSMFNTPKLAVDNAFRSSHRQRKLNYFSHDFQISKYIL